MGSGDILVRGESLSASEAAGWVAKLIMNGGRLDFYLLDSALVGA